MTEVRQRGLTYHLDYSKVYWNSRLEFEHELMIKSLEAGEEVSVRETFAVISTYADVCWRMLAYAGVCCMEEVWDLVWGIDVC